MARPLAQGADQIRQTFSKRKKGMVLKAAQLSALSKAKVGCAARVPRQAG
jgi:hypothetical protein